MHDLVIYGLSLLLICRLPGCAQGFLVPYLKLLTLITTEVFTFLTANINRLTTTDKQPGSQGSGGFRSKCG